jgi:hypothetical protein
MAYYDALLRTLTPKALTGDKDAVTSLLAVLDRRAKLVGMDQPDRVLVAVGPTPEAAASRWADAPREEQISRTEQILAILAEAKPAGETVIDVEGGNGAHPNGDTPPG